MKRDSIRFHPRSLSSITKWGFATLIAWDLGSVATAAAFASKNFRPQVDKNGFYPIHVCIDPNSHTSQKGAGALSGFVHARNPRLDEVIDHLRMALRNSFELHTTIRFNGWNICENPTTPDTGVSGKSVRLLIKPQIANQVDAIHGTSIQFSAWGPSYATCINYHAGHARMEYSMDCAGEYGLHEFGHILGFRHEFIHPARPASCAKEEAPSSPDQYSQTFDINKEFLLVNDTFDYDSLMTYDDGCVDRTGVRFGSPGPNANDIKALQLAYPVVNLEPVSNQLDFGGAYGVVDGGTVVNNPATGAESCPQGFQAHRVFGSWGTDNAVHMCFREHSDQGRIYDFGGMWGYVEGRSTVNPLSGKSACPIGYETQRLLGHYNQDFDLHVCYRSAQASPDLYFGGVIGNVETYTTNNPATRRPDCPVGYFRQMALHNTNVDWPLSYCYAYANW